MYPNHWNRYKVESDQPASDGQPRSIELVQPVTERTCKFCDYIDITTKGNGRTRTIYDIDSTGNRVDITIKLQEYQCKVCKRRFLGRLPSCVDGENNISKDLVDCMVDEFMDTATLTGTPAYHTITTKYGVSAKVFSDGLAKRMEKAKKRIRSLQPCTIFSIYPFDYGQQRCCALWGYDNKERPILYDIQCGYQADLVRKYLSDHPFQFRETPINAYADLSPDILMAISQVLYPKEYEQCIKESEFDRKCGSNQSIDESSEDLHKVYCAHSVGVLRILLRDNIVRFRDNQNSSLGRLRKPFEECLSQLEMRVTDDSFGAANFDMFLNLWQKHAESSGTASLIAPLYKDLRKAAPACKVGLSIGTDICNPMPYMKFIGTFYSKQYSFEEMCYIVLNCDATRNNQKIRFQTLMQHSYDPTPAGDVYRFYTDLEELNKLLGL